MRHQTCGFFGENRYFIDCIKNNVESETSFACATKTMELVDRLHTRCNTRSIHANREAALNDRGGLIASSVGAQLPRTGLLVVRAGMP